ncbi:MAG TPA: dihydrofolate reductase family protein, partial [Woeseiaceae bacterium]|nr:dihydrofolate reductase family protein [Woeseiaceae bacterium]
NDVLVEAGPGVSGHLLSRRLVDELVIYQAPHIMGSETKPMFRTPGWTQLADRLALDVIDVRRVGRDIRMTARIRD